MNRDPKTGRFSKKGTGKKTFFEIHRDENGRFISNEEYEQRKEEERDERRDELESQFEDEGEDLNFDEEEFLSGEE